MSFSCLPWIFNQSIHLCDQRGGKFYDVEQVSLSLCSSLLSSQCTHHVIIQYKSNGLKETLLINNVSYEELLRKGYHKYWVMKPLTCYPLCKL
jgi:hypothetical protein